MTKHLLIFALLVFAPLEVTLADACTTEPRILVVGDSLSAGYGLRLGESWVDLLGERMARAGLPHSVVNASISGDTSSGGRERLPAALVKHRPEIVVIELGGNDGLRGQSVKALKSNLAAMTEAAQRAGAVPVLLGMQIPPNYGARYARAFAGVFADLAQQQSLPWEDFFLEGVALDPELMQADGIHPTAQAQPRMLANAWPAIETALKLAAERRGAAGCAAPASP